MLRQQLQDFEEVVVVMGVYGGPREFILVGSCPVHGSFGWRIPACANQTDLV